MLVVSRDASTEAAADAAGKRPDSVLVCHHSSQALLLDKAKSWAPTTIAQWQKTLTKTYYAAAFVIISCCLKEAEIGPVIDVIKKHIADRTQEVPKRYEGRPVDQRDTLHVATLDKTSGRSQSENEESTLPQIQLSIKAASRAQLVSREGKESIKRPQYMLRAAQGGNKKFNGKIITEQVELRHPEGENEAEGWPTNTEESGNQERLESISEERKDDFIILFLPASQTETRPELVLSTDTGWKTIKELGDLPTVTAVMMGNFIITPDDSKCKCLKESTFSLEMHWIDRAVSRDVKRAESTTSASAVEKEAESNNTAGGNVSINHTEQEKNIPSEEPVILSTPLNTMMEADMMKTETTTVNMDIKETTSREQVLNQLSPATTARPAARSEPRFRSRESGMGTSHTGLRMRDEPVLAGNEANGPEAAGSFHKVSAAAAP